MLRLEKQLVVNQCKTTHITLESTQPDEIFLGTIMYHTEIKYCSQLGDLFPQEGAR